MNNPFNFKNIGVRTNVASSVASNFASNKPLQNFDENFIKSWVSNLNTKIDDNRLLFEYYADNDNPSIFYVILKIDSNKTNNKVLNIFRAESYNNIIWQYDLSSDFMYNIYEKGKSYFYNVMKNYYEVVEKQMEMYIYYLKFNQPLTDMINIIFIYNFFIKNNIAENVVNQFMNFVKTSKDSDSTKCNKLYKYFLSIIFIKIIQSSKNSKVFFSIEYGLEYYFYFFGVDNNVFTDDYKKDLTLEKLKKTIFSGNITEFINKTDLSSKIDHEVIRRSSIRVPLQNSGEMKLLLNENTINKDINKYFSGNNNKKIILKLFINNGVRFGFAQIIMTFLLGDLDKGMDTKYKQTTTNKTLAPTLDIYNDNKNICTKSFIKRDIIIPDLNRNMKNAQNETIGNYTASININFTQNKITTTYEFEGVDKDFLLSNLRTYDILTPITIIEPENSNSTYEIIEYNTSLEPEKAYPKILVFNFDEKCEELLTDSFYVSKEKREKKQIQEGIIDNFITEVNDIKPAIVVVCTRNSISKTDKHYQHSIKDKIRDLNKNNEVNYFPLLKVDSTLQSNVRSLKSVGKTLCGLRTRVYVDQKQLSFTYKKIGLESYYGKGNELVNTYEYNNTVPSVPPNKNKILSNKPEPREQIGKIIKYDAKRTTNPNDKNKGAITINLVLDLYNDDIKKQFIFCNYLPDKNIVSNFIVNNLNQKSIIPDDKNIYICFLTNKKSNENI